jgi:hypothetical protein
MVRCGKPIVLGIKKTKNSKEKAKICFHSILYLRFYYYHCVEPPQYNCNIVESGVKPKPNPLLVDY